MYKNYLVLITLLGICGLQATQDERDQAKKYAKKLSAKMSHNDRIEFLKRIKEIQKLQEKIDEETKSQANESEKISSQNPVIEDSDFFTNKQGKTSYYARKNYHDEGTYTINIYPEEPNLVFAGDLKKKLHAIILDGKITQCHTSYIDHDTNQHHYKKHNTSTCLHMLTYFKDMMNDYKTTMAQQNPEQK